MRIRPEVEAQLCSLGLSVELTGLLRDVISDAWPDHEPTPYENLQDGVMNAYDEGVRDGETKYANKLFNRINKLL